MLLVLTTAGVLMLCPAMGWGQWEWEDIDAYTERALTEGTTAPERPYFGEAREQLREIDLGPYIQRDEQGREQEVLIVVWTGERIFCAHCGELLRDTTHFENVRLEESVNYFDDGTHGDLVPNDGLPTSIKKIDRDFIGPRCYQHMIFLESLRDRAEFRDAYLSAFLGMNPMEPEEPQTFFSEVGVAPLDPESRLAVDPMASVMPGAPGYEEKYSFVALDDLRKKKIRQFEENVIWEFKRKPMHINFYLHPNEIKPYVPSVVGQAAASAARVTPRSRWGMLREEAGEYASRAVPY